MKILKNIPLAHHTTFSIGGRAKYFAEAKDTEDLKELINFAKTNDLRVFVFSGGSNVLFSDAGFEGLVIKFIANSNIARNNLYVELDAGASLKRFLEYLALAHLGGFENLYGIPGSVGGAIRGNAGAFGVEIKDYLVSAQALNTKTLEIKEFTNKQCRFDYRDSFFKQNKEWVILRAKFTFKQADEAYLREQMSHILQERYKRQLQDVKSAGSFFKNPQAPKDIVRLFEKEKNTKSHGGRVPAGWLIDKCGLKGVKVGGAQISQTSANYILNTGNASFGDVQELSGLVKETIKREFNILLEEEVSVIG